MTEANKMFEKLGYEKYENNEKTKEIYIFCGLEKIVFDKKLKIVKVSTINGASAKLPIALDMKELKAINKKVQELGWI